MSTPPADSYTGPTYAEVMEEMRRRAQVQWPKPVWQLPDCGLLSVEQLNVDPPQFFQVDSRGEMIPSGQMREIRGQALAHAAYIGPALGEDFDLEDTERLERIVAAAKRFEKYLIEGE